MTCNKAIIIVAGGKGLRMGGDIPKQFVPIAGKPILMRTIERFKEYDAAIQIVLVLPESQLDYWKSLCAEYGFTQEVTIANGGDTRFHSVMNGLALVNPEVQLIGVHDGVRPFVSVATIAACYDEAARSGAAVPVIEPVETVRHLTSADGTSETVARGDYRLVQTPQVFTADLLRRAYRQSFTPFFTDDASVVEALGHSVTLVAGNRENIKITTPFDMVVGEAILG